MPIESVHPPGLCATHADRVVPVIVGPGCTRRDLPSSERVRVWIVEMAAGAEWPQVDQHGLSGEEVYVLDGELMEGDHRYGPGSSLSFGPHSSHRPRTEIGVRLFGINLRE